MTNMNKALGGELLVPLNIVYAVIILKIKIQSNIKSPTMNKATIMVTRGKKTALISLLNFAKVNIHFGVLFVSSISLSKSPRVWSCL